MYTSAWGRFYSFHFFLCAHDVNGLDVSSPRRIIIQNWGSISSGCLLLCLGRLRNEDSKTGRARVIDLSQATMLSLCYRCISNNLQVSSRVCYGYLWSSNWYVNGCFRQKWLDIYNAQAIYSITDKYNIIVGWCSLAFSSSSAVRPNTSIWMHVMMHSAFNRKEKNK